MGKTFPRAADIRQADVGYIQIHAPRAVVVTRINGFTEIYKVNQVQFSGVNTIALKSYTKMSSYVTHRTSRPSNCTDFL